MSTILQKYPFEKRNIAFVPSEDNKAKRLEGLLSDGQQAGEISEATLNQSMTIWHNIKGIIPGILAAPSLDFMSEGRVLLTWNQGEHHLDIEIIPNAPIEFFYRNRNTDETWEYEYEAGAKLPHEVFQYINKFRCVT